MLRMFFEDGLFSSRSYDLVKLWHNRIGTSKLHHFIHFYFPDDHGFMMEVQTDPMEGTSASDGDGASAWDTCIFYIEKTVQTAYIVRNFMAFCFLSSHLKLYRRMRCRWKSQ